MNDQRGRMGKDAVAQRGVDDLVLMPKITEQDIVANLHKRYMNDLIYTNIGPVLISINPFRRIEALYEQKCLLSYRGRFRHELPPHVFALAEEAYRGVKGEGDNQCVIISGESGAGKTEASKLVMQYVAAVSGNSAGVDFVKHVILESNPLLEAFGNAKTLRNNNSSRFGKYFEINFNKAGDPCGGRITNYLLEKSRIIFQNVGERNFHVFYQLLMGASDTEANSLQLYSPEHFWYLCQSQCYTVDGIDDAKEFADTRNAMNVMQIPPEVQANIWRLVAGILHLGNVSFREGAKGSAGVADENVLALASQFLGVEPFALQNALLFRVLNTGGGGAKKMSTYNVPQSAEQAASARDALAKTIYSRMFDFIVEQVNRALQSQGSQASTIIGVLDIYGFEIFEKNGFEQFCINFVNEKLQQYFIELTLKAEQEEYVSEGIQWTPIKYFNNKVVCDLIEGKVPPGVFSMLDDVCYTMHSQTSGVDVKFLQKCSGQYSSHPHFRGMNTAFMIKHYAGDVTYEVDGFCEKNKDTLFNDIIEVMQMSNNSLLVSWFPEDTQQLQKKRPTTAGFKLKSSCGELMAALSKCSPHYIRCIKPNENKAYHDWDEQRVRHQVQYLGLLENVRVRRAGFAYRAPFDRFLKRYKKLSNKTWGVWGEWSGAPLDGCKALLADLGLDNQQWQLGRTKVFIRHPETLFFLEECLDRRDYDCALRIQKAWKHWKSRKHQLEQRKFAADLLKGKKERQRLSVNRKYEFDYISYDCNFPLQDCVRGSGTKEATAFSDQCLVLNRRCQPERRDIIVTDQAVYFTQRRKRSGQMTYVLKRRVPLTSIGGLSLSSLQDNFVVLHVPSEYDTVFENERKTELITIILENYKLATGRDLQCNFTDRIQYKASNKAQRELVFTKNESASSQPSLKKSRHTLTLSFREGDVIFIVQKDPGGWWEGEMNGRRGWIPANYVQE
ncbi:Unconventional myosin-Ie [Balamuthia mandrillaris]